MNLGRYREHAYDVFFKAYLLLAKVYKVRGKELILNIITQKLEFTEDPYQVESIIFACKSLLEAFDKDEICLNFLRKVFAKLINT